MTFQSHSNLTKSHSNLTDRNRSQHKKILKTYKHEQRNNKFIAATILFCSLYLWISFFIFHITKIYPKVARQHTPIFKPTIIRTNKTMTIEFYSKTLSQTTCAGQILIYSLVWWIRPFITITFPYRNNAGQYSVICINK